MKVKLLQVVLGALGSAISILITHLANLPPDVIAGVALGAGPATTAVLGNVVANLA